MALVIAKYAEKDLPLARIWLRSWKARGWKTGIRFSKCKFSLRVINFSLRAPRGKDVVVSLRATRYGVRGWMKAPLVKFPAGATEETVLNCGRAL